MYRYELHMHCREGSACGWSSIHDIIRRYADMGYTGAAITDHFYSGNTRPDRHQPWKDFVEQYCRGYYEGRETAAKLGFQLLFGIEEGYGGAKEFLAYGFEPEFLIQRPHLRGASMEVWSKEIHSVGGFVAYAHPFRVRDYIPDPNAMPDISLVDGIEVYNCGNRPEDNQKAAAVFGDSGKVLIAGSDTHTDFFERCCGVDLPRLVTTSEGLAAELKRNEFKLWLGEP